MECRCYLWRPQGLATGISSESYKSNLQLQSIILKISPICSYAKRVVSFFSFLDSNCMQFIPSLISRHSRPSRPLRSNLFFHFIIIL
jgi:hypothetical protein